MSSETGPVTNVYGFISTAIRFAAVKFVKMVDQHALILPCRYDDITTISLPDYVYGVIPTFINHVTNKLCMIVELHELTLNVRKSHHK